MEPVEEFRNHARECRKRAHSDADAAERAQWKLLADRWDRCIETAEAANAAVEALDHTRLRVVKLPAGCRPHHSR